MLKRGLRLSFLFYQKKVENYKNFWYNIYTKIRKEDDIMPNYTVNFNIGDQTFCTCKLYNPPRIGEKIRYDDSYGEKVVLQIKDIIYEFTPGEHRGVTVTAQCKLL